MADIAIVAGQCFLDEEGFHFFETHLFQTLGRLAGPQSKVLHAEKILLRH